MDHLFATTLNQLLVKASHNQNLSCVVRFLTNAAEVRYSDNPVRMSEIQKTCTSPPSQKNHLPDVCAVIENHPSVVDENSNSTTELNETSPPPKRKIVKVKIILSKKNEEKDVDSAAVVEGEDVVPVAEEDCATHETQKPKHIPVMGRLALFAKMKASEREDKERSEKDKEDERIIHELVTSKFDETLRHYKRRSLERQLNRTRNSIFVNFEVENEGQIIEKDAPEGSVKGEEEEGKQDRLQNGVESDLTKPSGQLNSYIYDSEEFLKSALGDDYNMAETPSSLNETLPTAADRSVGTSCISDLISRGGTYCSSTVVARDFQRMSSTMLSTEVEEDGVRGRKHRRAEELMAEATAQYQATAQASKAVRFCEESDEFTGSLEHVEAERLLLVSTCRREALLEEITKLDYDTVNEDGNLGSVTISGLTFQRNEDLENPSSNEHSEWFVCVLHCGAKVCSTSAKKTDLRTVTFAEDFRFDGLERDFEIDVCLYAMKLRNRHPKQTHCPSPVKIFPFHRSSRSSLPSVKTSGFLLQAKATIRIGDLAKTSFPLFKLPKTSPFLPCLSATLTTHLTLPDALKGFLDVGKETVTGTVWNRYWCCLEGCKVRCFRYPGDEEEREVFDLRESASKVVAAAERRVCARPRTLMLGMYEERAEGLMVVRWFLSADSVGEMKRWEGTINGVLSALKCWSYIRY